jgi:hypothetical protein
MTERLKMKFILWLTILSVIFAGCIFDSGKSDYEKLYPETDNYGYMNINNIFQGGELNGRFYFDKSVALIRYDIREIILGFYDKKTQIFFRIELQGTKPGTYYASVKREKSPYIIEPTHLEIKDIHYFAIYKNAWLNLTIESIANNIITGSFGGILHTIEHPGVQSYTPMTISGRFSVPFPDSTL